MHSAPPPKSSTQVDPFAQPGRDARDEEGKVLRGRGKRIGGPVPNTKPELSDASIPATRDPSGLRAHEEEPEPLRLS